MTNVFDYNIEHLNPYTEQGNVALNLNAVEHAIDLKRLVRFNYKHIDDCPTTDYWRHSLIIPTKVLTGKFGDLQLFGYDVNKQGYRRFYLKNIERVFITNVSYDDHNNTIKSNSIN